MYKKKSEFFGIFWNFLEKVLGQKYFSTPWNFARVVSLDSDELGESDDTTLVRNRSRNEKLWSEKSARERAVRAQSSKKNQDLGSGIGGFGIVVYRLKLTYAYTLHTYRIERAASGA